MKSSLYSLKNHTGKQIKTLKKIAVTAAAFAFVLFSAAGCGTTSEVNASASNLAAAGTESAGKTPAARGQGIRITVPAPSFSGSTEDNNWIPQVIQDTLTSNFAEFSSMTVIDRKNEDVLKAEQKHSEEAIFSEEYAIELGKVTQAQYIVAINIINTNASYNITFRVLDTSTNEIKASYNNAFTMAQINAGLPTKAATKTILPKLGVELTEKELAVLSSAANVVEQQKITATVNLAKGMSAEKNNNIVEALSYYAESGNSEANLRFNDLSNYVSTGNIREDAKNSIAARKAWLKTFADLQVYIDRNAITLRYDVNPGEQKVDYKSETVTIPFSFDFAVNPAAHEICKKIEEGLKATGKKEEWSVNYKDFKIYIPQYYVYFTLKNENGKVLGTRRVRIDPSDKWKDYSKSANAAAPVMTTAYWFTRTDGVYKTSRNRTVKDDKKYYVEFENLAIDSITDKLQFGIEKITVNEEEIYNREKGKYEYVAAIDNPPIKVTVLGVPEAAMPQSALGAAQIKWPAEDPAPFGTYEEGKKGPAGGRVFWAEKKGVKVNGKVYHYMEVCPVIYGRQSDEVTDFTSRFLIKTGKRGSVASIAGENVNQDFGYGWDATNKLIAAAEAAGSGSSVAPVKNCAYGGYTDWYIPNDEEQKALSRFLYWKGTYHLRHKSDVNYIFTFGGTKSYDGDSWQSTRSEYSAPLTGSGSYDGHYSPEKYEAFILIRLF